MLGTRPNFAVRKDFICLCDIETATMDGKAVVMLMTQGQGWQFLQDLHPEVVKLAMYAIRLTACLDQSHRGGLGRFSLKELGLLGTIFQHDLYEINPMPGAGDLVHDPTFNITRLALQIYSDLVLFPAAEIYHARNRLYRELMGALRDYFDAGYSPYSVQQVLALWAVVMGAMVSEFTYERGWYLQKMSELLTELDLEWGTFKTCMEQFIWWDYMLDDRARDTWEAALALTGRGRSFALRGKLKSED